MTTITLPDDLEARVSAEAERLGTTTEVLAIEELRKRFVNPCTSDDPTKYANAAEFWAGYIGTWDGPADSIGANHSRLFAEGLEAKRQKGRL